MIAWVKRQDPVILMMQIIMAPIVVGIIFMVYAMVWVTVLDVIHS